MRGSVLSLLFISFSGLAHSQVQPGELLLNSFTGPPSLIHYRTDGTVVLKTTGGTGDQWEGAAILPNGDWVTTRRLPDGINIFDGVTGVEIASWDFPGFATAGDVGVFSDGTIAVVEQSDRVWRFDTAGNVIASWSVSGHPFGILVDHQDHVWTCDVTSTVIWHTDGLGNKINEFSSGGDAGDITMALDGTLFVTRRSSGQVAHYAQDGTLLGSFSATGMGGTEAIAMGADQTLWVSAENATRLLNFDQSGTLLGGFILAPEVFPIFLTIPVPQLEDIGTNYCGPAIVNSTGQSAVISAFGSTVAAANQLELTAGQLPKNVFGYFLNSDLKGFTASPPGAQGNLCLGGGIGGHRKQVASARGTGDLVINVDLTALPRPNGTHSVVAGETWNFQCWYRDDNGGPTSNFTDGIEIVFQ